MLSLASLYKLVCKSSIAIFVSYHLAVAQLSYAHAHSSLELSPCVGGSFEQYVILSESQTIESLAKKAQIPIKRFRQLNPLYAFHPKEYLLPEGTFLRLPVCFLRPVQPVLSKANHKKQDPSATILAKIVPAKKVILPKKTARSQNIEDYFTKKISEDHQLAKNNLATEDVVEQETMANLSDSVDQWVSSFGNARVDLNLTSNGSLKTSEILLLLPFYRDKDINIFAQTAYHHFGLNLQNNFSVGLRHFQKNLMFGANFGIQYDLLKSHIRAALGFEYAGDFFHLAANYYMPLSDDHDDLLGSFMGKAAKGYSLEGKAYLPVLPSLGVSYRYEKYNSLRTDIYFSGNFLDEPYRHSLGMSYSPVPLIDFQANYSSNGHEKFWASGLQLTYRFGIPLKDQLESSHVSEVRRLAARKNDFILNSPDIVLTYE